MASHQLFSLASPEAHLSLHPTAIIEPPLLGSGCAVSMCRDAFYTQQIGSNLDDVILVENTTTDRWESATIWGCRNRELAQRRAECAARLTAQHPELKRSALVQLINIETNRIDNIGLWRGQNNIGKILMICRHCLRQGLEPTIDYDLLRSANIHLFGQRLSF